MSSRKHKIMIINASLSSLEIPIICCFLAIFIFVDRLIRNIFVCLFAYRYIVFNSEPRTSKKFCVKRRLNNIIVAVFVICLLCVVVLALLLC